MGTEPQVRTVSELVEAVKRAREVKEGKISPSEGKQLEYIQLPLYQRFLVWNPEKRRRFISSIHRDLPIGVFLLHREFVQEGLSQLTLIDGLQRMTSINDYVRAPLSFNQYIQLPESLKEPLEEALRHQSISTDHLPAAMDRWFQEVSTVALVDGYRPDKLLENLVQTLGSEADLTDVESLDGAVVNFLEGLERWVDISNYRIPILIYEGDEENLATAFELLNSEGTILSKYDIFAAQWATDLIEIANDEIRDEAQAKYREWEKAGYTVELPEDDKGERAHNLYEYMLGLGRYLTNEYPALFKRSTSKTDTESAGFVISSIAHQLKPTKAQMPNLPTKMPTEDGIINPLGYEEALLKATEDVDKALRSFLHIRFNTNDGKATYDHAHAELQMASLICAALLLRFDPEKDWKQRKDWAKRRLLFEKAVPQHYLLDILENAWSGAGDTLAFERVWETDDDGKPTGDVSNHYLTEVSADRIKDALQTWFERESLPRVQLKRGTPRDIDKLLLRLVYCMVLKAAEDLDHTQAFDIEHIYPVARIVDAIDPSKDQGWPINCVSNFMLLGKAMNRKKKSMTVKEVLESIEDEEERKEEVAKVERFLLSDLSMIVVDGPTNPDSGLPDPTRESYEKFLVDRWPHLLERILATLKV